MNFSDLGGWKCIDSEWIKESQDQTNYICINTNIRKTPYITLSIKIDGHKLISDYFKQLTNLNNFNYNYSFTYQNLTIIYFTECGILKEKIVDMIKIDVDLLFPKIMKLVAFL